jgi:hypothetical protein
MNWIEKQFMRIPKGIRFTAYITLLPVFFCLAMIALVVMCVAYLADTGYSFIKHEWDGFQ